MLSILIDSDLFKQFEYDAHEVSIIRNLEGDQKRLRIYKVLKLLNICKQDVDNLMDFVTNNDIFDFDDLIGRLHTDFASNLFDFNKITIQNIFYLYIEITDTTHCFLLKMQFLNAHLNDCLDLNDNNYINEYLYEYSSTVNCSDMMIKFFKLKESKLYVLKMKSILMHLDLYERDRYINRINFLYGIKLHNLRNNK